MPDIYPKSENISMTKKILIINGPNLNMLGKREPEIYGSQTIDDIRSLCDKQAQKLGLKCDFRQSNEEGTIVNWIQEAAGFTGIIINAGAYTHTSVAIRDALLSVDKPVIEVHLSNIFKREEFRHHSFISDIAKGVICGLGSNGYLFAIQAIADGTRA